jgi:hypothetical protein
VHALVVAREHHRRGLRSYTLMLAAVSIAHLLMILRQDAGDG